MIPYSSTIGSQFTKYPEVLGVSVQEWNDIKGELRAIGNSTLETTKRWHSQDERATKRYITEVRKRIQLFAEYEDVWPAVKYIKSWLCAKASSRNKPITDANIRRSSTGTGPSSRGQSLPPFAKGISGLIDFLLELDRRMDSILPLLVSAGVLNTTLLIDVASMSGKAQWRFFHKDSGIPALQTRILMRRLNEFMDHESR